MKWGLLVGFLLYTGLAESQTIIHTYVALCDNENQGIVPVPAKLGNGEDPDNNLYWGAMYGVRSYFKRSMDWTLITTKPHPNKYILERAIFKHKTKDAYMVADAYKGIEIKKCIDDMLNAAAGNDTETVKFRENEETTTLRMKDATLVCYTGHDGLMEFEANNVTPANDGISRQTIVLACISSNFFGEPMKQTTAEPVLWTTGLMAPEAYTLHAAIDSWLKGETGKQIDERAAQEYHKFQKCGINPARGLFKTGW